MKIAAITRFKHGILFQLLKKHGWSQNELARRCGITPHLIGSAINLHHRPSMKTIDAIQKAFAEVGEYVDVTELFPDAYVGFSQSAAVQHVQFADLTPQQLEDYSEHQKLLLQDAQPPLPDTVVNTMEALSAFDEILSPKQKDQVSMKFIDGLTLEEIAKKYGCTAEGIRHNLNIALGKISKHLNRVAKKVDIDNLKVEVFRGKDGVYRPRKEHLEYLKGLEVKLFRGYDGVFRPLMDHIERTREEKHERSIEPNDRGSASARATQSGDSREDQDASALPDLRPDSGPLHNDSP